jgi:mono/diheme cytochrome c family protein
LQLTFKHVAQRKLALAGKPSGLALSALWYLGKEQVSPRTIKAIREKLTPEAFEEFRAETTAMPAWMADTLRRYEQEVAGA